MSDALSRQMSNMCQELSLRCVNALSEHYKFDNDEAVRLLGLSMIKVERKGLVVKAAKVISSAKPRFPLPYNGEFNDSWCYALRQNNGLYTQCTGLRKGENRFCKSCGSSMQKIGAEEPEYGTIQQRLSVDIFEYTDPKGRKPVAYTKVMKKYKISESEVVEEAGKFNIIVNETHFVAPSQVVKRGRPKAEKVEKPKGLKGRPKKDKKVIAVEGDDESEDLFASLVANSLEYEDNVSSISLDKSEANEDNQSAEKAVKEEEKEAKRLAAEASKKEKDEKQAAEKAIKKEAERLAKEEEKEAKRLAAEASKKEKETKTKRAKKADEDEEEEPDVVKKFEFEGKKYLKSKTSGICYDYIEYVTNGEQVVVGKWNNSTNKIEFTEVTKDEDEDEDE